ncbi:protein KIAA0100 [Cimex lectularius]|uniref:FMP27/BLTP2/Hobbit GFWDK motif-containing RBG unit domain-containing protein n=1 Tax=Cimex lectularius TaxID=79782 RepID=A0A8I6R726_CIMLE|nr:protein KIAA0100 [Cimex lectularius]
MFWIGEIVFVCLIVYYFVTRILPWFLAWIITRCYRIDAKIGRMRFPYLTLHDIHLTTNGYTIEIDRIELRSSFLSSEVTKLISLTIQDMRVNKDMCNTSGHSTWRPPESVEGAKIPPLIITIAQFMCVRVINVTCAIMGKDYVFHGTLNEVNIDASVVHSARSLLVSSSLGSLNARLFKQTAPKLSFTVAASLSSEATLVATTPLIIQNVDIMFKNIKTIVGEDLVTSFDWMQSKENTTFMGKRNYFDYQLFINRTAPILPQKLSLLFENCVLTDSLDVDIASMKNFLAKSTFKPSEQQICGFNGCGDIVLVLEGLDMKSTNDNYLELSKLQITTNVEHTGINSTIEMRDFNFAYEESKMNWITQFLQLDNYGGNQVKSWSWSELPVRLKLELWNISITLKLPDLSPAALGLSHYKFRYDSQPGPNGDVYEIITESVWCQLNKIWSTSALRKEHSWGTALYLGFFFVKGNSLMLEAMIDTLRIEWSPPFSQLLNHFLRFIQEKFKSKNLNKNEMEKSKIHLNIAFTKTNIFFIANNKVCLMKRIENGVFDCNWPSKFSLEADGIKLCSITPISSSFVCTRSQDIKSYYGCLDSIHVECNKTHSITMVKVSRQISFSWNPNLHLKIREMFLQINSFLKNLQKDFAPKVETVDTSDKYMKLNVILKGHMKCLLKLSNNHNFTVMTDDFTYNSTSADCVWSSSLLTIAIDSADIFTIEFLHFTTLRDHELVRAERANNEEFILPWNRTWLITMKSVKAIFPYEHNFSSAVQDDFITVFKWLKNLHRSQNSDSNKLPPDLFIKIKEFLFEMSDDPFEVRVRDNYELLEDEYKENLKRQKTLEEKISKKSKTHLIMPSEKVDDLYAALSALSTKIYIKRSKMLKEQGTRTRLFAWIVSELQILALADHSIHGLENAVANMIQIDQKSPWPSKGLEFSTLWCRSIVVNCKELKFQLRDFPQPWLVFGGMQMWGKLVGAEQVPTRRAKRVVKLDLGDGWGTTDIERNMTSLKFYHDLNCEVEHFSYAFGPCWEPVIAQCYLSFEKIVRASLDPSPPLPLWDKLRLLLHGRVTMVIRQLTVLLHASLDPYNKTEEMEITWSSVAVDWTNAKVVFNGDLDIYVRTASKYDDCRLLHLPNLRLSIKLGWVCLGDPNDHHSVMPCAPDKLPDYSSNQEHDSFRAFRSQNLNITLALETKPVNESANGLNCPVALLYGSTLRWFENLKLILSGVTRPTRRGTVFNTLRPRKLPLSRHYKRVHLLLSLHTFQVHYWMSFAMQRGFKLTGESIAFSSEHQLSLVPVNDGLKHRPRAEWTVVYMTCELGNAEIWLRSALPNNDQFSEKVSLKQTVEKCYFLSVGKVSYGREGAGLGNTKTPIHRLVVYGLKGAWTTRNRDVVFALFDTFMKTKQLRKNLSTEALKGFRGETNTLKPPAHGNDTQSLSANASNNIQATPSPMSKLQCGHAATMLQQLIAEADTKAVVFSDEPIIEPNEKQLQGLAACQHSDDVIYENWLFALVNSQVLLKGPETKGYVIISASKAEILQRVHRPVWKDRTLVTKTTWVGSLQSMQYYATVSAGENDSLDDNIMWLNVDNIKDKDECVIAELPDIPQLVGSGRSVGGVVSETVGASSVGKNPPLQLQRIVSRCKCEFFYVCYGESSMSPSTLIGVPTPPCEDSTSLWEHHLPPVDAFTLMHHDLNVCTNSLQYTMLLDIVNNLLLHVEKSRKEAYERLQRMRFQLQLQSVEDQKRPIQEAQTRVRALLCKLRALEKEMYLVQRALGDEPNSSHLQQQMENLDKQVYSCKESLTLRSEELDAMLSWYKETQLVGQKTSMLRGDNVVTVDRASEICFKHAQWRLTEADGQLGIADLILSNFLYTKNSKSDDSVEHLLELGYVRMSNLLPNPIYQEVLQPTEILNNMPIDRKRALRVFCREKAPVGGISVKEHFEINLVPLTIGLTKKFYSKMLKFCFPERDGEDGDLSEDNESSKRYKLYSKGKETSFYVPIERKDDVEKMKERAEKNKLFIYIKIPEVPVKVSYKGNKEKNLEDIRDFSLVIPTLEYHNVTWTWLDLLLAMKSDTRRVILSQAIKQKLQIKIRTGNDEGASPQEEDKARMLFGNRHMPGENKSLKRGIFKFPK